MAMGLLQFLLLELGGAIKFITRGRILSLDLGVVARGWAGCYEISHQKSEFVLRHIIVPYEDYLPYNFINQYENLTL